MTKTHYSIFVACDITIAPEEVIEFYKQIRDTCDKTGHRAFLPIDFVGSRETKNLSDKQSYDCVIYHIRQSKLGVFYIGFNSIDSGVMLGEAKRTNKPIILLYEQDKENFLRRTEPKIWWIPKTPQEIKASPHRGLITPGSYTSFLVPESEDKNIIGEIKFKTREEALNKLEKEIREFFG